jgi:hypothetical protein
MKKSREGCSPATMSSAAKYSSALNLFLRYSAPATITATSLEDLKRSTKGKDSVPYPTHVRPLPSAIRIEISA